MSNKARDVRDGLLAYATRAGATLRMNTVVTGFAPLDGGWRVECDGAPPIDADAVIVATGGLSVPNTGSDGLGLRELARLGHTDASRLRGADAASPPPTRRSPS